MSVLWKPKDVAQLQIPSRCKHNRRVHAKYISLINFWNRLLRRFHCWSLQENRFVVEKRTGQFNGRCTSCQDALIFFSCHCKIAYSQKLYTEIRWEYTDRLWKWTVMRPNSSLHYLQQERLLQWSPESNPWSWGSEPMAVG